MTGPISTEDLGLTLMHEHILYGQPGGGHADRILLSHDFVIRFPGRPLDIPDAFRSLIVHWHPSNVFRTVVPRLRREGVTEEQIDTILRKNPRRIFEGAC